ncbi:MAG: hypothetical protein MUO76_08765 [Anaerolineaceae bacterium]|nr:hypothetical protein [Anaerolineaceae bacterium]
MKIKLFSILIITSILIIAIFLPVRADETRTSSLADQTWVRLGGPLGGLGYDIRMRPDNQYLLCFIPHQINP